MNSLTEIFGEPIHIVTRAQLINDGDLVDLMTLSPEVAAVCKQHFKYPIAVSRAVFEIMQKAVENKRWSNDYAGIVHDMLWMCKARGRSVSESKRYFTVIINGAGRTKFHNFELTVGPGDNAEPVITIMLPGED